jgi:hypothetical protein
MDIVLEIPSSDAPILKDLGEFSVGEFSPKKFGGGDVVIQALVTLSSISIPIVGKIIIERIRANKHVEIIADGKKIKGLSAENAIQVLKELSDNES